MKLLTSLLFLVTNVCFSQETINVTNITGQKLSDVSVFQLLESNSLLGITDSTGNVKLTLNENQKYLFHLLGYTDRTFTGQELKSSPIVRLATAVYQLNEVVVGKSKTKLIKIVNKPGNWSLGEANTVQTTFERVVPIRIEKSGFLYKFSLYAYQNFPGEVRAFRFIMLNDNHGTPGNSLMNTSINGNLRKGKMVFNLDSLGTFIEKGTYYIGYETQNTGKPNTNFKKVDTKNGVWIKYPMVYIKGKNVNSPKAFVRSNLKDWSLGEIGYAGGKDKSEKKYMDFAYELEMQIPIAN